MARPTPCRLLFLVWIAFVVRGLFYCVQQPMWEGYDEWAHFAYIQHLAEYGRLPARTDTVSKEIRASLSLMPSAYGLNGFNLPLITHEDYWRLQPQERLVRSRALVFCIRNIFTNKGSACLLKRYAASPRTASR